MVAVVTDLHVVDSEFKTVIEMEQCFRGNCKVLANSSVMKFAVEQVSKRVRQVSSLPVLVRTFKTAVVINSLFVMLAVRDVCCTNSDCPCHA